MSIAADMLSPVGSLIRVISLRSSGSAAARTWGWEAGQDRIDDVESTPLLFEIVFGDGSTWRGCALSMETDRKDAAQPSLDRAMFLGPSDGAPMERGSTYGATRNPCAGYTCWWASARGRDSPRSRSLGLALARSGPS